MLILRIGTYRCLAEQTATVRRLQHTQSAVISDEAYCPFAFVARYFCLLAEVIKFHFYSRQFFRWFHFSSIDCDGFLW